MTYLHIGENMKKIYNFLISMPFMLFLTALFGTASAIATFIENDYGTETAWAVVYGTHWFEVIMALLAISLIGNIFKYKLFKKEKIPVLLFHVGFLVALVGAIVTRYIGYEGMMHIREGDSSHTITSSNSFLQVKYFGNKDTILLEKKLLMSKISSNYFTESEDINGKEIKVEYKDYLSNATNQIVSDENGKAMINMLILLPNSQPKEKILKDQETISGKDIVITLNNKNSENGFNIYTRDDKFFFKSTKDLNWLKMKDRSSGVFEANKEYPFESGKLYDINGTKLVPRNLYTKASIKLIDANKVGGRKMNVASKSALIVNASYNGDTQEVIMFGHGKGTKGTPVAKEIGGQKFLFEWGSKVIKIPFEIKLVDFQLERYPGSGSPSSYASEVILIDKEKDVEMPFRIFMNNILDYRSYRFFQSSYDTDEKGTVLSVNNDPGKLPTYLAYLLMAIGFVLTILNPKSRFRKLASAIQKDTLKNSSIAILLSFMFLFSPSSSIADDIDKAIKEAQSYDIDHANAFGDLLIQSVDGRVKPIDTFSNEIMRKLVKKTTLHDMNSNQVILGMITNPTAWQQIRMIKITHTKLQKILGMEDGEKYASFNDFFDQSKNSYKLATYAQEAAQKRPIQRNEFDRRVIKADEKLNISYMIFTGDLFKIVPKTDDPMKKWYGVRDSISTFPTDESNEVRELFVNYFSSIDKARKDGDWSKATAQLDKLKAYQYKISADIIPSKNKLRAEKIFKQLSITNKLIFVYLIIGLALLSSILAKMIKPTLNIKSVIKITQTIFFISFVIHSLILIARWYIGGHAPWSNAYEAMLYVSWSMALAGVVFSRLSIIVPALTSIIAGITLGAAFVTDMDPQITNLVPVLKSYWLNIHVSIITASYGFLGLSMILGFFTLILFILRSPKRPDIDRSIKEASRINEMTAIFGLMMLTIGNFLGGVWANESWGRYWGWDPKETWAWISILAYVIVVHIRFVPALAKNYAYNYAVLSTVAYSIIVMTFVGVNFYLSGMHSYAAGDPVPIPTYLYYIIATVLLVIAFAFPKRVIKKV